MFETVAPEKATRASRSALYEGLTLSVVVHGLAAIAAVASNLWEVSFPTDSPSLSISFVLAAPPPPPPPPPPKPLEVKQEVATTVQVIRPESLMAPTVIPDEIPVVKQEVIAPVAFAAATGVEGGVSDGVDAGVIGGVPLGETGGDLGGTVGGIVTDIPDGRVHIARDKKLPMMPLSQVYPIYPEDARVRSWEDAMVVRYIIGKDGRVKEVTVLSPPQRGIFVDSTVRAIRSWRFKPMIKDGEKTEVVHELTVFYKLNEGAT